MRWSHLSATPDDDSLPGRAAPAVPPLPLALPDATVRTFDTPDFAGMTFYEVRAKSLINRVPGSSRVPFEWTVNPYRGCSHACTYCLAGETPILMADGSTRPLAQLRPGDALIGTAGAGAHRRYVTTTVLDHWRTTKPAYRVTLSDGTRLVSSGDHRFLTDRGWRHVSPAEPHQPALAVGDLLHGVGHFAEPPKESPDYQAGFLCGLVRGDAGGGHSARESDAWIRADGYLEDVALHEALRWPELPTSGWYRGFLAGAFAAVGRADRLAVIFSAADRGYLSRVVEALAHLGLPSRTTLARARPGSGGQVETDRDLWATLRFRHLTGVRGARAHPAALRHLHRHRRLHRRRRGQPQLLRPQHAHLPRPRPRPRLRHPHRGEDQLRRADPPGAQQRALVRRTDRDGHQRRRLPASRGPLPVDAGDPGRAARPREPVLHPHQGHADPARPPPAPRGGRGHPGRPRLLSGFPRRGRVALGRARHAAPAPPVGRRPPAHRRRATGERPDGADPARPHRHRRVHRRNRRRRRRRGCDKRDPDRPAPAARRPRVVCVLARTRTSGPAAALPRALRQRLLPSPGLPGRDRGPGAHGRPPPGPAPRSDRRDPARRRPAGRAGSAGRAGRAAHPAVTGRRRCGPAEVARPPSAGCDGAELLHAHTAAAATFAGRPVIVGPAITWTLRLPWEGPEITDPDQPPGIAFHAMRQRRMVTHFRVVP